MAQRKQQLNLKQIRSLGSEIVAAQTTDGQLDDRRLTDLDFMSSATIVKQNQKW